MKKNNLRLFSIMTLKGNFLSVLLITALLFTLSTAFSQNANYDSLKLLEPVKAYGYSFNNTRFYKSAVFPYDTLRLAYKDSNAVAVKNGKMFLYDGIFWRNPITKGFPALGIPYMTAGSVLTADANELIYQASSLSVGPATASSTSSLFLNNGRAEIGGRFSGMYFNVGSGYAAGGTYDASKFYQWWNRGNILMTLGYQSNGFPTGYLQLANNVDAYFPKIATGSNLMAVIEATTGKLMAQAIPSGGGGGTSFSYTGLSGAGYYEALTQSATPSTPATGFRLYADATNRFSWVGTNGFVRTFDGLANTGNRNYSLPDQSGQLTLDNNTTSLSNKTISGASNTISQIPAATAIIGVLPVLNGGTGVGTSTGTVNAVLSNSPTLVTPVLGAASATSLVAGGSLAASALLDLQSTTKGMLIMRMTTAQQNAVLSPANGLTIFNLDSSANVQYSTAFGWRQMNGLDIIFTPQSVVTYVGGIPVIGLDTSIVKGDTVLVSRHQVNQRINNTVGSMLKQGTGYTAVAATPGSDYPGLASDNIYTGLTTYRGTTISDGATLGAELTTTGSGTNWTGTNFSAGYTHAIGSVVALTSLYAAVVSTYYQVSWTITGAAGTVALSFGGVNLGSAVSPGQNGNSGPLAISTAAFTVTPTSNFDGVVTVSIKVNGHSVTPTMQWTNSSNTSTLELRQTNSLTNTIIGNGAGRRTTTATGLTALGSSALFNNTTGGNNTAIGNLTLAANSTGGNNLAFGTGALQANTTASNNLGIGVFSLNANSTGAGNVGLGGSSMLGMTTGNFNTATGYLAMAAATTGSQNTVVGYQAGRFITDLVTANTAMNNAVMVGWNARPLASGETNSIVIGNNAVSLGSNSAVWGNSLTTLNRMYGSFGNTDAQAAGSLNWVGAASIGGSRQNITSGTTATVTAGVKRVYINLASLASTFTLTTATMQDGDELQLYFGGTIAAGSPVVTTFTLTPVAGSVYGSLTLTTANGGDFASYVWDATNSLLRRIK